jgi:hypothetical protein
MTGVQNYNGTGIEVQHAEILINMWRRLRDLVIRERFLSIHDFRAFCNGQEQQNLRL